LLVVDEEQHFGVAHKERLKQLRSEVHVLTLTATPIPRTLQLALSGVKECRSSRRRRSTAWRYALRRAVRPVTVREALCANTIAVARVLCLPTLADSRGRGIPQATVPEVKVARRHGQMAPTRLEDIMSPSTTASSTCCCRRLSSRAARHPDANTMIIHRATCSAGQLYNCGTHRPSKARAYAYLTVPPNRTLTANADRRPRYCRRWTRWVPIQSCEHDSTFAAPASWRRASGQVASRIELYQDMLEEAVASLRGTIAGEADGAWSPQITWNGRPDPGGLRDGISTSAWPFIAVWPTSKTMRRSSLSAPTYRSLRSATAEVDTLLKIVTSNALPRRSGRKIDAGRRRPSFRSARTEFAARETIGWLATHPSWQGASDQSCSSAAIGQRRKSASAVCISA